MYLPKGELDGYGGGGGGGGSMNKKWQNILAPQRLNQTSGALILDPVKVSSDLKTANFV